MLALQGTLQLREQCETPSRLLHQVLLAETPLRRALRCQPVERSLLQRCRCRLSTLKEGPLQQQQHLRRRGVPMCPILFPLPSKCRRRNTQRLLQVALQASWRPQGRQCLNHSCRLVREQVARCVHMPLRHGLLRRRLWQLPARLLLGTLQTLPSQLQTLQLPRPPGRSTG